MHWFLFYSAFARRNAVISTLMSQKNSKIRVCTTLMNRWSTIASIHPRAFLLWRTHNALQNITNITLQSSLVLENYLDMCIHDDCCIPTMHALLSISCLFFFFMHSFHQNMSHLCADASRIFSAPSTLPLSVDQVAGMVRQTRCPGLGGFFCGVSETGVDFLTEIRYHWLTNARWINRLYSPPGVDFQPHRYVK